jgi:ABC-type amino acid transport substrate-binding protein
LTGFDIEIERAIARLIGIDLIFADMAWEEHLAKVAAGESDLAAGATYSPEHERHAYFSKPYRSGTDVPMRNGPCERSAG